MPGRPTTMLDSRYSDPAAVAVDWAVTRTVLADAELCWVTTVRADGRPHVTPVVPVWMEGAVHFHTGAAEQKAANIRANPHVILTVGCSRWDEGIDVVVEGDAVHVTELATLERLAQLWATKWDGRWQLTAQDLGFRNPAQDGGTSQVFAVRPTRIYAHAKGDPFGATKHQF